MTFDEYQVAAHEFAGFSCDDFFYPLLGLGGECGEVLDKMKKQYRDKLVRNIKDVSPEDKKALILELGDIAWYLAEITTRLGYDFQDVFRLNIEKLASRATRNKIGGEGDDR